MLQWGDQEKKSDATGRVRVRQLAKQKRINGKSTHNASTVKYSRRERSCSRVSIARPRDLNARSKINTQHAHTHTTVKQTLAYATGNNKTTVVVALYVI